ncbi:MAG: hypothetical protein ABIP58_07785, partial [Dehalococcoidia bacterium]
MGFLRLLRVRLTLWYVLLLALILAAFSAGVYVALRESLYGNLDDSLEVRAEIVVGIVETSGGVDLELPGESVEGEEYIRTFDQAGDVVSDNSSDQHRPPTDSDDVNAALSGEATWR